MANNNGQLIQQPADLRLLLPGQRRPRDPARAGRRSPPPTASRGSRCGCTCCVAAWADTVEEELHWLGLAAQVLESESILTGPLLLPRQHRADRDPWLPGDTVQVVTDDLALDSMSEAFQALSTDYRLRCPTRPGDLHRRRAASRSASRSRTVGRAASDERDAVSADGPDRDQRRPGAGAAPAGARRASAATRSPTRPCRRRAAGRLGGRRRGCCPSAPTPPVAVRRPRTRRRRTVPARAAHPPTARRGRRCGSTTRPPLRAAPARR